MNILVSPREAFLKLKEKPTFWLPLFLFVAVGTFTSWMFLQRVTYEDVKGEFQEWVDAHPEANISPEKVDEMAEKRYAMMKKIGPISTAIFFPILILILSGYFLGLFLILGEDLRFKQSLAVITHSYIPMILASLLSLGILFMKGSVPLREMKSVLKSNPGFLFSPKEQPVLHALFSSLDLFTLWVLFLMAYGFSIVADVPKKKAFLSVFVTWGVFVGVKVLLRVIFS